LTLDLELGMEKFGSGIRNKHPGSATLTYFDLFVSERVSGTNQRLPYGRSDSQRLWHYYQVVRHPYHEGMERKKDKNNILRYVYVTSVIDKIDLLSTFEF
jgi:hypothetical protein